MKVITISIWILMSSLVYGQQNISLINEVSISINNTDVSNDNTVNKFGVGIGVYHLTRKEKQFNFVFGGEYNFTSQFKKNLYEGNFANSQDVTYSIHNFSIPLKLRYNLGKNVKFVVELGAFVDILLFANRKGTFNTYYLDQNNVLIFDEKEFKEKAKLSGLNYGPSGGIGIRIPIKEQELMIGFNYKLGLNTLDSNRNIYNRYYILALGIIF